jgi:hypothetical protein
VGTIVFREPVSRPPVPVLDDEIPAKVGSCAPRVYFEISHESFASAALDGDEVGSVNDIAVGSCHRFDGGLPVLIELES